MHKFLLPRNYDHKITTCNYPTKIVPSEEMVEGEEGCLSFPYFFFFLKDPIGLVTECPTSGKECTIELTGWNARILV